MFLKLGLEGGRIAVIELKRNAICEKIYIYIYIMENCMCKTIQLSVKIARNFKWNLYLDT